MYRVSRRLLCRESEHFKDILSKGDGFGDEQTAEKPFIMNEEVSEFEMETFLEFLYASYVTPHPFFS